MDTKISAFTPATSVSATDGYDIIQDGTNKLATHQMMKDYVLGGAIPLTGIITPTQITSSQNDYAPTGYATASVWRVSTSKNLLSITGIAAISNAVLFIHNVGAFTIILPAANANSSAANQFLFDGDVELGANDCILINYDATSSRWRIVESDSHPFVKDPRRRASIVSDFDDSSATSIWTVANSGTGTSMQQSNYGVNATNKAVGVLQIDTGTTSTGRASMVWGSVSTSPEPSQVPARLGAMIFYSRVAVEALSTSAEEFSVRTGVSAGYTGIVSTNGVNWVYNRAADGDFWSTRTTAGGFTTKNVTTFPATTNYVWLAFFVTAAWDSVEFFASNDGKTWTHYFTHTANIPNAAMLVEPIQILKSVGNTQRNADVDAVMFSYEFPRSNS